MKKVLIWTAWAAVPIAALSFHMSKGQEWLARDRAAALVSLANQAATAEDFESAAERYAEARAALPPGMEEEAMTLQLNELRARMSAGQLVDTQEQLLTLLPQADERTKPRVRAMLGEVSYSIAWLMRLEGAAEDEWKPETELARQEYRLLAETLDEPVQDQMNLEAVVRLERMSLDELKALPLPKNCQGCKNCSQKKRGQRITKTSGKKPTDARKEAQKQSASEAMNWGKGS